MAWMKGEDKYAISTDGNGSACSGKVNTSPANGKK
jgi:hypothetical protein